MAERDAARRAGPARQRPDPAGNAPPWAGGGAARGRRGAGRRDLSADGKGGGPGVSPLLKMAGAAASPGACSRGAAEERARRPRRPLRSARCSLLSGVTLLSLRGRGLPLCGRRPIPERVRPRGRRSVTLFLAAAWPGRPAARPCVHHVRSEGCGPECGWCCPAGPSGRGALAWHAPGAGARQPRECVLPRSHVHLRREQHRAARGRRWPTHVGPTPVWTRCAPPSVRCNFCNMFSGCNGTCLWLGV